MEAAWEKLQKDPRMRLALDLDSMGICAVGRDPQSQPGVLVRLRNALIV